MKKGIVLLLFFALFLQSSSFAEEKISWEERLIGSAFKNLARAFVAIVDIKKLKKDNIKKLKKMDEQKFKKRYAEVYEFIREFPAALKNSYAIKEEMPRAQAIKNIESLNKQKIYGIIDSLSDKTVSDIFKRYLAEKKEQIQQSNLMQQVNRTWNKIIAGARAKP